MTTNMERQIQGQGQDARTRHKTECKVDRVMDKG